MATPKELRERFWKELKSDMTMMVGLAAVDEAHTRPMTAQLTNDNHGPIWFFTAKDTALAQSLRQDHRAIATFTSKGHELFATVHGTLRLDNDRAMIDELWNRYVAAWFEGGKDDPKLALLRFDPDDAEIWLNDSSFLAGVKLMLGMDPKKEYQDKVARVAMR
jgi:general stress protein 26